MTRKCQPTECEAKVYTRPNGASYSWRPVGTFFEHDGESYVVLLASSTPTEHCKGCSLHKVSAEACLQLRRRSFGECMSLCRGDARAVIFHKVGTQIRDKEVRAVNVRAGLERFF